MQIFTSRIRRLFNFSQNTAFGYISFKIRFTDEHLRDAAAATVRAYLTAFRAVERHVTLKRLADLNSDRIDHAARKWRDEDDVSRETEACYKRHLKAALNWAKEAGLLAQAVKITMPPRQKKKKVMKGRPITLEEFERMLSKIQLGFIESTKGKEESKLKISDKAKKAAAVRLAKDAAAAAPGVRRLLIGLWLSGLRLGEAVTMSWDDDTRICPDFAGRRPMLRIPADQQKSGDETLLPMTADFAAFLAETSEELRVGRVFPVQGRHGSQIMDVGNIGRIITGIGKVASVVVDKASGKFASAHDLRRAFGARWATKVMPAVLKELMRHADIETTMKYYVGQNAESTADLLWKLGEGVNTFVNSEASEAVVEKSSSTQTLDPQQVSKYPRQDSNLRPAD